MAKAAGLVRSGEPLALDATAWNNLREIAGRPPLPRDRSRSQSLLGGLEILVQNQTGDEIPQFGVVSLGGVVVDPIDATAAAEFARAPAVLGTLPAAGQFGGWGIAQEPIADERFGRVLVSGVSPVKLDLYSADHRYADAAGGSLETLQSDDCGTARILYQPAGTGSAVWAYVLLGPSSIVGWAVPTGPVSPNDPTNCQFATFEGVGYGEEIEMLWVADGDAGTISTGALCYRTRIGSRWILSPAGCPT